MEPSGDPTHRGRYDDHDGTTVAESVVTTVATATDSDPNALDPLYRTVDTDALDALVGGTESHPADLTVSFPYSGHLVVIDGDGSIRLYEQDE